MPTSKGTAVFDFDGTITSKDTFLEFIKFSYGRFSLYKCMFFHLPFTLLYFMKLYPNYKLKELYFSFFFKGKPYIDIKKKGDLFGENLLPSLIFSSVSDVLNWHKERGHDIYILSASSDIWLGRWCEMNGCKFIGTEFESKDGLFTGKISGNNCYGKEKAERIKPILTENQYAISYGYGDSTSDKYFLNLMDKQFLMPLNRENVSKILKEIEIN
ncbi:MAG: HAD-IB family hydrolase [Bacteroidales bacterium]|nr:HAD-IB family hydrolase [Bacteroidales bacterium]